MTGTITDEWHQTACILCSINCGIEVRLDGRRFVRIRGDKAHPASQGYTCEKALRLDHYQNGRHRLTSPLRRRPDGTFEEIDWDTAIAEIAARFVDIRDTIGGDKIFYYGGGGQGNHLGGGYGGATRRPSARSTRPTPWPRRRPASSGSTASSSAGPSCHTTGDYEHAEVAVFVGKNPWQSHGFPRARPILKAIASDPDRALIVIDPRRTETADLADHHLQVRPGTDAFCLGALLGVLVQEDLVDRGFLREHTPNGEPVLAALAQVPVAEWSERTRRGRGRCAGRGPTHRARPRASRSSRTSASSRRRTRTLNSYLEKLIYLLTGNFARPGTMNIHTAMASLAGGGGSGASGSRRARTSPVTGQRIIIGLIPGTAVPDEILTDHPDRFRAALIESANPAHSLPDSARMREALEALDFVVVIDVAMTETAQLADYVLPAASQFEKWEATFFNLEFPDNAFQLRAPLLDPLPGTLPEVEIHARLVRAMGGYTDDDIAPLRAAAEQGRAAFADAFLTATVGRPELSSLAPLVLYEALGPSLGEGREGAAALWGLAHQCALAYPDSVRRAGFDGEGLELGEALFEAVLDGRSGVIFTVDDYDETWRRLATADGLVNLAIPELLEEFAGLEHEHPEASAVVDAFPFVLSAGERRSSTANTIYRDPTWRKEGDRDGALRMHPDDAASVGVQPGGRVRITTKRASVDAVVECNDTMRPGHISLPNGLGLSYPDDSGRPIVHGVPLNELTSTDDRDWLAGTPHHKHVRARVEVLT